MKPKEKLDLKPKEKLDLKPKILFTKSATPFILEALGNKIDKKGYVINSKTKEYVLDADGNPFKSTKLYGIVQKKYITNFCQLIEIADEHLAKDKPF